MTRIDNRIWKSVAMMFLILFVLVWLNEIVDLPHHLLGTIKTPINWSQAIIEAILVMVIGFITVFILVHNIHKRVEIEQALQERSQDLSKRVREINCLYAISRFMEKKDTTLNEILQGIVMIIPTAWQYPDTVCAQIILDGHAFKTKKFKKTYDKISTDINVHGRKRGILEAYSLKKKSVPNGKILMQEESNLLIMIAARLGKIIEHKKAEETLRDSEERYRTTIESMGDAMHVVDSDFRFILLNKSFRQWNKELGFPTNIIGKRILDVYPFLQAKVLDEYQRVFETGKILITEEKTRIGDQEFITETRKIPVFEANKVTKVITVVKDITDRKIAEEKIKQSLKEKEALLREIHHRVKNNLQIISSLLKLQAGRVKDDYVKKVFQESKNRITAMALVHEILYQSEDLAEIDLKQYIMYIGKNLFKIFGTRSRHMKFKVEGDDIFLEINQAVPIGLMLNEIISNSLKHAFQDGQEGEISVHSALTKAGEVQLVLKDNGRGIPEHIEYRNAKTLGMRLIYGLVKEQLKGSLILSRHPGTQYTIKFKKKDNRGMR